MMRSFAQSTTICEILNTFPALQFTQNLPATHGRAGKQSRARLLHLHREGSGGTSTGGRFATHIPCRNRRRAIRFKVCVGSSSR